MDEERPQPGTGKAATAPGELPPEALERLEAAVVTQWRFEGLVRTALLLLVVTFATAPAIAAGGGTLFVAGAGALLALVGAVLVGWMPRARYRRFRFAVDDHYLYVKDGVLVHREKVIPVSRMQHVDIQRGPIERLLGIASLSVYTAGGTGATFRLPGLEPRRGEAIRAHILATKG